MIKDNTEATETPGATDTTAMAYVTANVTAKTRWPIVRRDKTTGDIILDPEFLDSIPKPDPDSADSQDTHAKPRRHQIWEILLVWYLTVYRTDRRKCPVMEELLKADWIFRPSKVKRDRRRRQPPGRVLPAVRSAQENLVRRLMLEKGIKSYSELERRTTIPRQAIHYWVTGRRPFSIENTVKMADAFEIPVDKFREMVQNPGVEPPPPPDAPKPPPEPPAEPQPE